MLTTFAALAYITAATDQLAAAVRDGDREAAERSIDRVDADGFRTSALALAAGYAKTSLGRTDATE